MVGRGRSTWRNATSPTASASGAQGDVTDNLTLPSDTRNPPPIATATAITSRTMEITSASSSHHGVLVRARFGSATPTVITATLVQLNHTRVHRSLPVSRNRVG